MSANTYGRQVVVPLMNKSGGGVIAGDVVIIDTTNDAAFTTTTSAGYTGFVGIVQETIAANATGRVLTSGYAALVNVNASVTRGYFGQTHTVAKQAASAGASRIVGVFCQFLTGGTTPTAHVLGFPDASSASGNVATDAIWDAAGDLAVGTGANTAARLASGAAGTVLTGAGVGSAPSWVAPVTGTYFVNQLAADVNIASPNTYYTGPSLTLSAGTWLLMGVVLCSSTSGTSGKFFTKLWDGTTVAASAQSNADEITAVGRVAIPIVGIAVIASGTPTWKISVAGDGGGANANILKAMTANGAGDNASTLIAIRIA